MRLNIQGSQHEKNRSEVRADVLLSQFKNMTPQQAANWVDTNVNNIATAKIALKMFAKMLVILAKDIT